MQLGAELLGVQKRLKVSLAERAVVELDDVERVEGTGTERTGQLHAPRTVRRPREEEFQAGVECSLSVPAVGDLLVDLRGMGRDTDTQRAGGNRANIM